MDADLDCPSCGTLLSIKPDLKLHYSTCCGRRICLDCIKSLFARSKQVVCVECGSASERKNYVGDDLDQQHYKTQIATREDLTKTFNFRRADFASVAEYNDYLEFVEDVVYERSFGSAEERSAARAKLLAFQKREKTRIAANAARLTEERSGRLEEAAGEEERGLDAEDEEYAELMRRPQVLRVRMPTVLREPSAAAAQKRLSGARLRKQQAAGGFQPLLDARRCREEAQSALWFRIR